MDWSKLAIALTVVGFIVSTIGLYQMFAGGRKKWKAAVFVPILAAAMTAATYLMIPSSYSSRTDPAQIGTREKEELVRSLASINDRISSLSATPRTAEEAAVGSVPSAQNDMNVTDAEDAAGSEDESGKNSDVANAGREVQQHDRGQQSLTKIRTIAKPTPQRALSGDRLQATSVNPADHDVAFPVVPAVQLTQLQPWKSVELVPLPPPPALEKQEYQVSIEWPRRKVFPPWCIIKRCD